MRIATLFVSSAACVATASAMINPLGAVVAVSLAGLGYFTNISPSSDVNLLNNNRTFDWQLRYIGTEHCYYNASYPNDFWNTRNGTKTISNNAKMLVNTLNKQPTFNAQNISFVAIPVFNDLIYGHGFTELAGKTRVERINLLNQEITFSNSIYINGLMELAEETRKEKIHFINREINRLFHIESTDVNKSAYCTPFRHCDPNFLGERFRVQRIADESVDNPTVCFKITDNQIKVERINPEDLSSNHTNCFAFQFIKDTQDLNITRLN